MNFRRSRCIYVSVVVVCLYIAIFCISYYAPLSRQYLDAIHTQVAVDFSSFGALFKPDSPRGQYSFNTWVDRIYDKTVATADSAATPIRMAKFAVERADAHERDEVPLPAFLRGAGDNPHLVPFDPRISLAIVLSHFNEQMRAGRAVDQLALDTFHWGDWTDLSELQSQMLAVGSERATCASLALKKSELNGSQQDVNLKADGFCIDDLDLAAKVKDPKTDAGLKKYLEQALKSPRRANFHVFDYPARCSQQNLLRLAQSYLNDFMPAPLAMHLLLPGQKSVRIAVASDVLSRVRLVDTPTASAVAQRSPKVDLRRELDALAAVAPLASASLNYTRQLQHLDFVDKLKETLLALSSRYDLTPQEQNYFNSLYLSLNTVLPTKYFDEAKLIRKERMWNYGAHYDWRFFKGLKNGSDMQMPLLHGLILAWLRFTNGNNITTWLAHGTLLSWYWNGLTFPWDSDIDVQMPIGELHKLALGFNQTVIVDFGQNFDDEIRHGRYFLDCGTWISKRGVENGLNNIDARFIDLDSGLYIDITALAVSGTFASRRYNDILPEKWQRKPKEYGELVPEHEIEINSYAQLYNCRNKHFLSMKELLPLRLTAMEGVPAYVANDFVNILQAEYGKGGTALAKFKSYAYLPRLRLWNSVRTIASYTRKQHQNPTPQVDLGTDGSAAKSVMDRMSVFTFSDQDYLELLASEPLMLMEYVISRDATELHEKEMSLLLEKKSTEHLFLENGDFKPHLKSLRRDVSNYIAKRDNVDLEKQYKELDKQYEAYKKQVRA